MSNSERIRQFNDGLEIQVNEKAPEILDALVDNYRTLKTSGEMIFPQEYKPDSMRPGGEYHGSHEHAMYFWNICGYMQGGTQSDFAFKKLTEIFYKHPDYFDSRLLAKTNHNEIISALKKHGLGQQGRVANAWIENAQRLVDRYDGDPRNIFSESSSYKECRDKICNDKKGGGFLGFQKKMTSMLFYFFTDEELIEKLNFPPPIDFHNLRVAFATEILTTNQVSFHKRDEIENMIGKVTLDYINDTETDPIELTNAIWGLSSNFCNQNPGNTSYKDENGKRVIRKEPEMATKSQSKAFFRSCGACAMRAYCTHCVPSGPYYTSGIIEVHDKPETIYQEQLSIF